LLLVIRNGNCFNSVAAVLAAIFVSSPFLDVSIFIVLFADRACGHAAGHILFSELLDPPV
jgi:hypothetical protein